LAPDAVLAQLIDLLLALVENVIFSFNEPSVVDFDDLSISQTGEIISSNRCQGHFPVLLNLCRSISAQ